MRHLFSGILIFISSLLWTQVPQGNSLELYSDYSSENPELRDILNFEGIEYLTLNFSGNELAEKTYHLSVKEIWNGVLRSESSIMNSADLPYEALQKINDSVFTLKVISKHTFDNKLKMTFKFPGFSTTREFEAIDSDDYSLRNVAESLGSSLKYDEKFYLLAYILPYEKDGTKYWCAVESSGKDIENWGKEFNIEHYLVFEMLFD